MAVKIYELPHDLCRLESKYCCLMHDRLLRPVVMVHSVHPRPYFVSDDDSMFFASKGPDYL